MMMRYRIGFILLLGFTAAPVFAGGTAALPLQGIGRGHTQRIYRGVFTPDSKTFLSVGIDSVVRAWNVADGSPSFTLTGHNGSIHGIGLAGDGLLVTGAEIGELFLWDLSTRKKVGAIGKTQHALHCLAVSHNGKLLATGGGEWKDNTPGELRLWDLQSHTEIVLLKGHRRLVLGVAFSPDDKLLAAVDYAGDLHIWNLATRKPIVTLFQENPAGAVSFSPDGKSLVVGDYRGRLNVWDTTHWLDEGVVHGHYGGVMWLRYSHQGNMLASAGWDGSIKLWNGHDVEALPPVRVGEHLDKAWMVAFAPDGKTLATAGEDRLVKFWTIPADFAKRYVPTVAKPAPVVAPARTGDARVALVTAQPLEAARTLQDLAIINLSKEKGIALLQRDAVDKILAEQKLNYSGLVEAKSAVQLGKILAVDLIGMIDVSIEGKEPVGLVVFDAVTGARLYDDGFGKEKFEQQLRAIAKGVQTSAQKWRAGSKHLKTVCVLPTRNADLPRGMDAYCEALGTTLERQLVQHASIVTLERKWLDSVNQEKTIAAEAQARELLASVLVVDLEIARGEQGKGVRGIVRVRDNAGKVLHTFAHQVGDDQGADLLGPLTRRLHVALETSEGAALVRPSREARRFLRETELLWRHGHHRQALQAAEAAYALMPDDETRIRLAECLLQYPREMWRKKPAATMAERAKFPPTKRTAEEVRAGLSLARRGHQLVDSAKGRVDELPDHGWFWSLAESNNCFYADAATWDALKVITITPADLSVADDILDYRATSLQRHQQRLQELAGMKRLSPATRLQRMTVGLRSNLVTAYASLAPDSASHQKALRDASKTWLDLSSRMTPDQFPVESASGFAESTLMPLAGRSDLKRSDADIDAAAEIFKALLKHPHPVMRLYGVNLQTKQDILLQRLTPQEADQRFRDNLDDAKRWIDQAPFKNPAPHRLAFYEFVKAVLWDAMFYMDRSVLDESYAGMVAFMIDRKDVAGPLAMTLVGHNLTLDRGKLLGKLQQIYRFQEMYAGSNHRLFFDPNKDVPRNLKNFETTILKLDPTLAKQKLEAPWDHVTPLVEAGKLTHASRLYAPVRHEEHVYFLAGVHDPKKKINVYLQLHRVGIEGGAVQALGKLPVTLKDYQGKTPYLAFSRSNCVVQSCVHRGQFIAGTVRDGLMIFPLEGGTPVRIGADEGLPAQEVNGLTALDNQIIASLEGGYLVQIDLATRRVEVLASSRRANKLSPFDNDRPFYIRSFVPDPPRQRVLFTVGLLGTLNSPNIGMWEYNLKARTFKKHLPMPWFNFSALHGNIVYMEHYQHGWLGQFDLAKDQFTLLQGRTPNGIDTQKPMGLPANFAAKFPDRLYHAGYFWEARAFARRSMQTDIEEFLPHPVLGYQPQVAVKECLEPGRAGELLIGDGRGLYVVRLKK